MPRPRLNLIRFHGVLAPNAKLRSEIVPGGPISVNESSDDLDDTPHHAASARMSWARLLKRVFDIDIEHCPHCGGTMKIIAAIEDPSVIAKILAHLGLPTSHLRCAVPAPLAVQPVLPVLAFAPPIPALTRLEHRHGLSLSSNRQLAPALLLVPTSM